MPPPLTAWAKSNSINTDWSAPVATVSTDWSANKTLDDSLIAYSSATLDYNDIDTYYNSYDPTTQTPEARVTTDWSATQKW